MKTTKNTEENSNRPDALLNRMRGHRAGLLEALKWATNALEASAALRRPGWEEEMVIVRNARIAIAKSEGRV